MKFLRQNDRPETQGGADTVALSLKSAGQAVVRLETQAGLLCYTGARNTFGIKSSAD